MTTELLTNDIWSHLTKTSKSNRKKSIVAVAYFSKGASKILPLLEGSSLLVDASKKAVTSGQTHPNDLLELYYKGVKIYSKQWLHAKMFVFGNSLYIGSTNASKNSAKLVEAVLKTTDKKIVNEAKKFIKSFCQMELGEEQLKKLQEDYEEPRFEAPRSNANKTKRNFENPSSFYIYHLKFINYSKEELEQSVKGKEEAKEKRLIKARHQVDEFVWTGKFLPKEGDIIMQITDEDSNLYASPPGVVIHKRQWKNNTMCYVEIPSKRRKNLKRLKKRLNNDDKKLLLRSGKRNSEFTEKLKSIWS